jgi:hypothetical protein
MVNPPRVNAAQNSLLSRRSFLTTTAVAGSAAALGVLGGGAWAAANTRGPKGPKEPPGIKGRIGATVTDYLYPGVSTRIVAASVFDGYVTSAIGAQVIQKYYFLESQWLTSPLPSDVIQLPAQYPDFKWIMCFRPSPDLKRSDQSGLQRSCELLTAAGIDFDAVLWQEPNGQHQTQFLTAADYQNYFYFYRPYVPDGVDVIYISCGSATEQDQVDFFPSQGGVAKVYADWYGNVYRTWLWQGNKTPLATLEGVADDNGLPFGLGEWGYGTTANDRIDENTKPSGADFVDYIISVFTDRLDADKTNGDVVYFDGRSAADTQNLITSTTDWKVPLYQRVYTALADANGSALVKIAGRGR